MESSMSEVERSNHELFMERCIQIAQGGLGNVAPNPLVGSVVVCDGRIIGEGFHAEFGKSHAEVNAINSVTDKEQLKKSTLYVSLEPCSHQGKTPPCADFIVAMGIPRVVVAVRDPFPEVSGQGIARLLEAGIEVIEGVLSERAMEVNRRFFTFQLKKRPYIILKWAQSLDGYVDIERLPGDDQKPIWITNELARAVVHRWRSEEQSIMVGTRTVELDNPRLSVRDWRGKSPIRVVIDRTLRLPADANVYDEVSQTLIMMGNNSGSASRRQLFLNRPNIEMVTIDFSRDIEPQIMEVLYQRSVQSIIIEGGPQILESFISRNLWDEARVFIGRKLFNSGVRAPVLLAQPITEDRLFDSILYTYRNV
ncbi:diaminohydroxyphosphoribosylaminopyrimidine deaminase [Williamwhitmania taraxaci]|uniref:Riboflavin biosynthesis protein RibD n=2 Tax=Williamwhitmania taraxaci TaxID=1640674 RepID=A0A1G6KPA5_9BACT|nr:diaminohydroxyphosphoribosylaminopyrimidine deaminase [Williamwhitmania taraxaci]